MLRGTQNKKVHTFLQRAGDLVVNEPCLIKEEHCRMNERAKCQPE